MKSTTAISPFLVSLIGLALMSLLLLIPFDSVLSKILDAPFLLEYVQLAIKMTIVFFICNYLIKKLNIKRIAGLSSLHSWRFKYLNLIPIYLVVLGMLSVVSKDFTQTSFINVFLLLFACLTVGFAEEFLFRGVLQSFFLKSYVNRKKGVFIGVCIPALVFGMFHLVNLINNDNTMVVLIQAVFATFIGFFFGALVLKTNKIIPVAITHGLINFSFSIAFLPGLAVTEQTGFSIAPIIVTLPLFITGLLIINRIKKEDVVKKLDESFNQ